MTNINHNNKLRQWREAKGWTVQEVADLLGMDETLLSRMERGLRPVSAERRVSIARALGARVRDLFEPLETEAPKAGQMPADDEGE